MRYFLEVAYRGTNYAGFQVQENAATVQGEIENALAVLLQREIKLTGSSRTDAGVHALQNFFHFDIDFELHHKSIYNLNAILPHDISVKHLYQVANNQHCRFDALTREYSYYIHRSKNPFLADRSWYYPYALDLSALREAGLLLLKETDFSSFAKRNSQAFTNYCTLSKSTWDEEGEQLVYTVRSNRFLRGMVRGLVGTMLQVGRSKTSLAQFEETIHAKDCTKANFATPAHGLFLVRVEYSFLP